MSLDKSAFQKPIRLAPDNFTDQLWGGDWIPRFKGLPASVGPVGESWEFSARAQRPTIACFDSGERVPLNDLVKQFPKEVLGGAGPILLKFIDAEDDLSVQVHPSDDQTLPSEKDCGKSEAWLILETGKRHGDGAIYIGFDRAKAAGYADAAQFESAFFDALNQANAQGPSDDPAVRAKAERLVLPFLNKVVVRPGEVYELRPGTIHAIGRGVRLFEIQQPSDITFRVWDWNRPDAAKKKIGKNEFRELHLKRAADVLDFRGTSPEDFRPAPFPTETPGEETILFDHDKKFAANRIRLADTASSVEVSTGGRFQILTVISGRVDIGGEVKPGHSVLLPASLGKLKIQALSAPAEVIRSYVPI